MMISAHHNRIEQLRESFKKKMEEADAWPGKVRTLLKKILMFFVKIQCRNDHSITNSKLLEGGGGTQRSHEICISQSNCKH